MAKDEENFVPDAETVKRFIAWLEKEQEKAETDIRSSFGILQEYFSQGTVYSIINIKRAVKNGKAFKL